MRTNRQNQKINLRSERGVGLVEVLVTLVVMAIGLLGMASMYVTTLQAKVTSQSRMRAVNLAYDLADRIRANPTGSTSYELGLNATPGAAGANCMQNASAAVACTPQQMALADLNQWVSSLTNATTGLPGSVSWQVARTAPTATAREIFTITLGWTEAPTGASQLNYALEVQMCNPNTTPTGHC